MTPKQVSKPGGKLGWCFVSGSMVPELPLPRVLLIFPIWDLIETQFLIQGQSGLPRFRIARDNTVRPYLKIKSNPHQHKQK